MLFRSYADSYRYVVSDTTFAPKMALLVLGSLAALYLLVSGRLWALKAGESATLGAKSIAAIAVLSWASVIVCGRLLSYL